MTALVSTISVNVAGVDRVFEIGWDEHTRQPVAGETLVIAGEYFVVDAVVFRKPDDLTGYVHMTLRVSYA